jgi:hypothetical protein
MVRTQIAFVVMRQVGIFIFIDNPDNQAHLGLFLHKSNSVFLPQIFQDGARESGKVQLCRMSGLLQGILQEIQQSLKRVKHGVRRHVAKVGGERRCRNEI